MPTKDMRTPGRLFLAGSLSGECIYSEMRSRPKLTPIDMVTCRRNLRLHDLPIRAYPGSIGILNTPIITCRRGENYIPREPPPHSRSTTDESITDAQRSDTNHQPLCAILSGILGDHPRYDSLCWRFLPHLRYPETTHAHLDPGAEST